MTSIFRLLEGFFEKIEIVDRYISNKKVIKGYSINN